MLDDIRQLPERLETLHDFASALDTWRHWAVGGKITTEAATWTTEILGNVEDHRFEALTEALAVISPGLLAPPTHEREPHSPDLDWSIGL